jgi:cytochrome c-type biogenesis protein CcmH/NrfG
VVPPLLCAGWVVARGPLRERLAGEPEGEPERERLAGPVLAGVLVCAMGLIAAWSALQPVRAAHAENAAYARLEAGSVPQAISIAKIGHKRDPLSLDPLFDLAAFEQLAGNTAEAGDALEKAVQLEPANPEPWRRLGEFRLNVTNDARGALAAYQAAYFLDPHSPQSISDVLVASRAVSG